jgi:hypothetical protein
MTSLDQSCAVEFGSSFAEEGHPTNDQTWLEVEAQASDCGPRIELCSAAESTKRLDWADDAVGGHVVVNVSLDDSIQAAQRINFAFSLRHGGFRCILEEAVLSSPPKLSETIYETLQSMLVAEVAGFEDCFAVDLARRLDDISEST